MSKPMQVRQVTDFTIFARFGVSPFFELAHEPDTAPPLPLNLGDVAAAELYARFLCQRFGVTTVSFERTTRLTCEEETAR